MQSSSGFVAGCSWAVVAWAGATLAGCATVAEETTRLFSSNTPAIAVVDGRVLWGVANFTSAREATVQLQNAETPSLACSGALRFTATSSGSVSLACTDGRAVTSTFHALTALSGTGSNLAASPGFAFTYGLTPDKAAGYLRLPTERLLRPGAD